jgi:hypothetical protein
MIEASARKRAKTTRERAELSITPPQHAVTGDFIDG